MERVSNIKPGVSVIVCCYNSAKRLPETVQHLAYQKLSPEIKWEIFIIDNASTDNTSQVAQKEWEKYGLSVPFKVLSEKRQGSRVAREKGIRESQYQYLLFCDDDNWLAPDYLQKAFRIMEKNQAIGALGGRGIAYSNVELPEWFQNYKPYYAVNEQGEQSGELSAKHAYLYGAGMVIRKEAYHSLIKKGFQPDMPGRIGKKLNSGEDNELCYAVRLSGYKLYYERSMTFRHFICKERLNLTHLTKLLRDIHYSSAWLIPYVKVLKGKKMGSTTWYIDQIFKTYCVGRAFFKVVFYKYYFKHLTLALINLKAERASWLSLLHQRKSYRKRYEKALNLKG
ncbi:glycosyltransferase [Xanthovirga aplysinae]|uniref:glycosyltransferase n=1 Tax=Xanthovirga aplysinae TaxID=2529853 RepID=UPI0012BC2279|nr:glycosyltransferase [Xanthovirga aplysinae]MTI30324.1 glycosyltransferase family 2 protein [Xanthovirga aplysinae]